MAFQPHTCVIVACDLCGNTETPDGDTPLYDSETEALEHVLADPEAFANTWHQRPDGRLACWRRDPLHDWAREQDGIVTPGPDAMTVSFDDQAVSQ